MYFREIWCPVSSMVAWERKVRYCVKVWDEWLNTRSIKPNKMAQAIGGRQRIHKLAKLSVFFDINVRRSSFHPHSKGANNNKKQNKTNGKSKFLTVIFIIVFIGTRKGALCTGPYSGLWTRSIGGSMDWEAVFSGHLRFQNSRPKKKYFSSFCSTEAINSKKRYSSQLEQVITISNTHLLVTFLKILKGFSMTNLSQI